MADERYNVPGLERGLRLLQLFDRQNTLWSAPDIARELDVPRSTVFRIIQTLELLGFVERSGSAYRLGPGDRLMLPRGTMHAATAGADGAAYLIGEKS